MKWKMFTRKPMFQVDLKKDILEIHEDFLLPHLEIIEVYRIMWIDQAGYLKKCYLNLKQNETNTFENVFSFNFM